MSAATAVLDKETSNSELPEHVDASSTFIVGAPFESDTNADILLRSSDDFEFRVQKNILSLASPVFNDMFSLPQPPPVVAPISSTALESPLPITPLPIIHLSETGPVIDILLRYCYPVKDAHDMDDFGTVVAVRTAAEKYDMSFIMARLDDYLELYRANDPRYTMMYYQSAFEHQDKGQMRKYLWNCLKFPLTLLLTDWHKTYSASSIPCIIKHHQTVSIRVGDYITKFFISGSSVAFQSCNTCMPLVAGTRQPVWWTRNIGSTVNNVYKEGPISRHLLPNLQQRTTMLCTSCKIPMLENWSMLDEQLYACIEKEAKKVCINFTLRTFESLTDPKLM